MLQETIDEPADPFYDGQNRALYAILGDRHNFSDFPTIAPEPRGLPDDLSEEVQRYLNWYLDEDQFVSYPSWVTLAEILGFDWDMPVELHVYANGQEFDAMSRPPLGKPGVIGEPAHALEAAHRDGWTYVGPEEMTEKIIAATEVAIQRAGLDEGLHEGTPHYLLPCDLQGDLWRVGFSSKACRSCKNLVHPKTSVASSGTVEARMAEHIRIPHQPPTRAGGSNVFRCRRNRRAIVFARCQPSSRSGMGMIKCGPGQSSNAYLINPSGRFQLGW